MTSKEDDNAQIARMLYENYLHRHVRHVPQFEIGDRAYFPNQSSILTSSSLEETSQKQVSRRLMLFRSNGCTHMQWSLRSVRCWLQYEPFNSLLRNDMITMMIRNRRCIKWHAENKQVHVRQRKTCSAINFHWKKIRHIGDGDGTRYVVRWYGYCADKDTVAPAGHRSSQFIDGYRKRAGFPMVTKNDSWSWRQLRSQWG